MRRGKYGNRKTLVDGVTFDSKAEARRWGELTLMQRAGAISNLRRQVPYRLADGVLLAGEKRKRPALTYVVDFEYTSAGGETILEDVKGFDTPMSRAKRHLMKAIHGLDVLVVR